MKTRHLLLATCTLVLTRPVVAQVPTALRLDSARVAWDVGDFPLALDRLRAVVSAPDGDQYLEPVALLTGEIYRTQEITTDGRNARVSSNGRYVLYESGPASAVMLHIASLANGTVRELANVKGMRGAFSSLGDRVAYLALKDTPELTAARAALDSLISASTIDRARILQQRQTIARLEASNSRVTVRNVETGDESVVALPGLQPSRVIFGPDGNLLIVAAGADPSRSDIYSASPTVLPTAVTDGPGLKREPVVAGNTLLYLIGAGSFGVKNLSSGAAATFQGTSPTLSADGSTVAFIGKDGNDNVVNTVFADGRSTPSVAARSPRPIQSPAISPDGSHVAYMMMPREDWEIYVASSDGNENERLTREIQHDLLPQWVSATQLLAVMGEARHRRSYLYDVRTRERTRLFHNNTVRTVAPEYEWAVSTDGNTVVIVAERDGDTVSPERGVYFTDLRSRVTKAELLDRIRAQANAERDLRARGQRTFAGVADAVRAAVRDVSTSRIYQYEDALFRFDSKYITKPGNGKAIEYLSNMLRSFGYQPEIQWFEPSRGVRTANVVATLTGTQNPELEYVVSSHFDSVEDGPGADDDATGASALLEAARVLAKRPQNATIRFAFFTGEEAGLFGSREFVRRAVEANDQIVGALNNDMVGFANDNRLDNTIRYSNDGIRDLQHAAAFLFTNMITYDAKYYKNTDAHAYYERYGDIVGGIGSYPILGNPHYHQSHDVLETINHQLVAEVSKTTVASLMRLATGPSRIKGLTATGSGTGVDLAWDAAPEKGVRAYIVSYVAPATPGVAATARRTLRAVTNKATLPAVAAGSEIWVKAVDDKGNEGWDWARTTIRQ